MTGSDDDDFDKEMEAWARERGLLPENAEPYVLTIADRIWNRACIAEAFDGERIGDQTLRSAITFDGMANNGGVHHGIEAMTEAELEAVVDGYTRFGLEGYVELIRRVSPGGDLAIDPAAIYDGELTEMELDEFDELEVRADDLFAELEEKRSLSAAFEAHHAKHPEDYAPLDDEARP